MNRRGFLGTLLGAAVAPFLPKPKEPEFYGKELIPEWKAVEHTISAGESFRMSRGIASLEGIVGHRGT